MPCQHPFDRPRPPRSATVQRHATPATPQDPRERLWRYGPIQPMPSEPSLLERLLFS